MGCILWIQILIYIVLQVLSWCMQYHAILDCIIMTLHCIRLPLSVLTHFALILLEDTSIHGIGLIFPECSCIIPKGLRRPLSYLNVSFEIFMRSWVPWNLRTPAAWLWHSSSPVWARITKFGSEVQNTLVKILIVRCLTSKVKFNVEVRISSILSLSMR